MDHPFSKSVTSAEKCNRLLELISPEDTLGIVMNADPDAIASALAARSDKQAWQIGRAHV